MKIAIHHQDKTFSERWIQYCIEKNIPYKIVNCHSSNIIADLEECDALLWHHQHSNYRDVLAAKPILYTLEHSGKVVFPDFRTSWHFDDKVAQKYLLESINAPLVPSYVFYNENEALAWLKTTSFPKVFKLKGGSGSRNVLLINSRSKASRLVKRAFGKGISTKNKSNLLKNRLWQIKRDKNKAAVVSFLKGLARTFVPSTYEKMHGKEKGYIYFQEFIPGNDYDTRLIVVGDRCFGIRRYNRKGDFKASGSGVFKYERDLFDIESIKIAFSVAEKLKAQSIAFDFIKDTSGKWLLVEISYGYSISAYDKCQGFWDRQLTWHNAMVNPQYFIIEDLIDKLGRAQKKS